MRQVTPISFCKFQVLHYSVYVLFRQYSFRAFHSNFSVLHIPDNNGHYRVFTRWGRVGQNGQHAITGIMSLEDANVRFGEKFREKTANTYRPGILPAAVHQARACKEAAITLIGIRKFNLAPKLNVNPGDLAKLLGKYVWATRGDVAWIVNPKYTHIFEAMPGKYSMMDTDY
jgi:predicted DNA-binding WGR domain protein